MLAAGPPPGDGSNVGVPKQLAAIFRAAAARPSVDGEAEDVLERALVAYVEAARSAWPDWGVEANDIVAYIASRTPPGRLPDEAHAADVLLACACVSGVPAAINAFHQRHSAVIARVLSRRGADTDLAEDVAQTVYESLLVAPPGLAPKIASYRGTGPLRAWVAAAAATTLMMMRRAAGRRPEQRSDAEPPPDLAITADIDPELRYLKERYRPQVEDAIARALERLSDRERTLLRLHLSEQMSIDQLGLMYGINRATAARWLAAARQSILAGARDALRAQLRLGPSEWESVVALVRSQLNVSIVRRLS